MENMVPKKFITEEEVKHALKIDSFRNLSKDKIMQFASMIPYMDKEVAISVINQFPTFVEFGKSAIGCYLEMCDNILSYNKESQTAAIMGFQTILDSLSRRMDKPDLCEEERKAITDDMISVAEKIAEIDIQNKRFLNRIHKRTIWAMLAVGALIGAGIGISSYIGNSGNDLPNLDDEVEDED